MNIKKLLTTAVLGISLLGFAGVGSATTYDINIYGASAQYTFWNYAAPDWIKSQAGCDSITPSVATSGSKNTITYADCGGNSYNVRVSSKASFDGILSLLGNDDYAAAGSDKEKCSATDPGYPGSATAAKYYRKMAERDGTLKCEKITIGASDVAGESFTQYSWGSLYGPADTGGTNIVERSFNGIDASSLPHANPFVVPFGFFVHNDVTYNGTPIDNLTRMQAVLLFSGQIMNWQDFGVQYPNLTTKICLRHAGSGTHATLDYAVIKGNGWGGQLVGYENRPDYPAAYDAGTPIIYFNDGTGDLLNCLNGQAGSVGYADADQAIKVGSGHTYANVNALAYQGEYPSADSIMNGRYDFWTNEWAYKDPNMNSTLLTKVNDLLSFAGNQSRIPAAEQNYWVVQNAMTFEKATDQEYPHR